MSGRIKKSLSISFRPALISDNLNETLKVNRFLANPIILIVVILLMDAGLIMLFSFIVNVIGSIPEMIKDSSHMERYINSAQFIPRLETVFVKWLFSGFSIFILILDIRLVYLIRMSFSDKAINKGTGGTSRWTTLLEIIRQYKEISLYPSVTEKRRYDEDTGDAKVLKVKYDDAGNPIEKTIRVKTNTFPGKPGMPVARWRDKLYIDYQTTNNLFLGATRSGKGEMFVFQLIDIFSRADKQINRPSMIIFDPKLELYKSSF